jgi:aspartate 1-decarboxylase
VTTEKSLKHSMKTGDLRPYLQVKIFNPDGTPRNVVGDIIEFDMKSASGNLVINGAAMTAVNAAQGIVEYRWQEGETDEAGIFRAEVVINGVDTFPKEGYITVEFAEDLD